MGAVALGIAGEMLDARGAARRFRLSRSLGVSVYGVRWRLAAGGTRLLAMGRRLSEGNG